MSEKSKGDTSRIVKNPLLSASVTGLTFNDFSHNALLMPAAPPIVIKPPSIDVNSSKDSPQSVTVGKKLDIDTTNFSEINLNSGIEEDLPLPNPKNYDNPLEGNGLEESSILSQAASSFSQLPSVASTVFSTFSKVLKDYTPATGQSREHSEEKETTKAQELQPELYESYSAVQPQFQSSNVEPVEPPQFYSPSDVGLAQKPSATLSNVSSSQNTYRISAKKKTYAQIPGLFTQVLTSSVAQPPPFTTSIFSSPQSQQQTSAVDLQLPPAPTSFAPLEPHDQSFPEDYDIHPPPPPPLVNVEEQQRTSSSLFSLSSFVPPVWQNLGGLVKSTSPIPTQEATAHPPTSTVPPLPFEVSSTPGSGNLLPRQDQQTYNNFSATTSQRKESLELLPQSVSPAPLPSGPPKQLPVGTGVSSFRLQKGTRHYKSALTPAASTFSAPTFTSAQQPFNPTSLLSPTQQTQETLSNVVSNLPATSNPGTEYQFYPPNQYPPTINSGISLQLSATPPVAPGVCPTNLSSTFAPSQQSQTTTSNTAFQPFSITPVVSSTSNQQTETLSSVASFQTTATPPLTSNTNPTSASILRPTNQPIPLQTSGTVFQPPPAANIETQNLPSQFTQNQQNQTTSKAILQPSVTPPTIRSDLLQNLQNNLQNQPFAGSFNQSHLNISDSSGTASSQSAAEFFFSPNDPILKRSSCVPPAPPNTAIEENPNQPPIYDFSQKVLQQKEAELQLPLLPPSNSISEAEFVNSDQQTSQLPPQQLLPSVGQPQTSTSPNEHNTGKIGFVQPPIGQIASAVESAPSDDKFDRRNIGFNFSQSSEVTSGCDSNNFFQPAPSAPFLDSSSTVVEKAETDSVNLPPPNAPETINVDNSDNIVSKAGSTTTQPEVHIENLYTPSFASNVGALGPPADIQNESLKSADQEFNSSTFGQTQTFFAPSAGFEEQQTSQIESAFASNNLSESGFYPGNDKHQIVIPKPEDSVNLVEKNLQNSQVHERENVFTNIFGDTSKPIENQAIQTINTFESVVEKGPVSDPPVFNIFNYFSADPKSFAQNNFNIGGEPRPSPVDVAPVVSQATPPPAIPTVDENLNRPISADVTARPSTETKTEQILSYPVNNTTATTTPNPLTNFFVPYGGSTNNSSGLDGQNNNSTVGRVRTTSDPVAFFDSFQQAPINSNPVKIFDSEPESITNDHQSIQNNNFSSDDVNSVNIQNFFNNPPPQNFVGGANDFNYNLLTSTQTLNVAKNYRGNRAQSPPSTLVEPPSSSCSEFSTEVYSQLGVNSNKSDDFGQHLSSEILELFDMATIAQNNLQATTNVVYRPVTRHWFYKKSVDKKHVWLPFSYLDSNLIEENFLQEGGLDTIPVEGGRYDVHIANRTRTPIFWSGSSSEVQRCSWFYMAMDSRYVPYEESVADLLEEEYKNASISGEWHRKIALPSGESVVFHGPTVMVHFIQAPTPDNWGTSAPTRRPRVVKRDIEEFNIEEGESNKVDHLLFMVHGIGSVCDLKFRPVEEVVDEFRSIANQLVQAHYRESRDKGDVGRVEVLPVSWHSELHSEESGIDKRLKAITLESIPKLRNFANDTLLDVLFYTSPVFCQNIMDIVAGTMNKVYLKYCQRNPNFHGGVSLAGHSLGSLILFDLLCHQKPYQEANLQNSENPDQVIAPMEFCTEPVSDSILTTSKQISYTMGPAGTGQPYINYPQLIFEPQKFFALGSPIGMFVTIRGIDALGLKFRLPTCPGFYNIFHPYDPVAYRIEALVNPDLATQRPVLIPHHKGRKRMHLELKETMARVGADLKQKIFDTFRSTIDSVCHLTTKTKPDTKEIVQEVDKVLDMQMNLDTQNRTRTDSLSTQPDTDAIETDLPLGNLNDSRRIDYVLQEAPLEFFNEYLFALTSHVCYWESADTILFIMKEIYSKIGVRADSQIPQQNMIIERPSPKKCAPSSSNNHPGMS